MCLNNYDYHILNHQHHHHRHHYRHCCHRNLILNPHLKPSHHPKERIVIAWENFGYIYISVDFIWTGCVVVSLNVQKKSIQACRCWSTAAALHEWNGLQQVTSTIMSTWIALTPKRFMEHAGSVGGSLLKSGVFSKRHGFDIRDLQTYHEQVEMVWEWHWETNESWIILRQKSLAAPNSTLDTSRVTSVVKSHVSWTSCQTCVHSESILWFTHDLVLQGLYDDKTK